MVKHSHTKGKGEREQNYLSSLLGFLEGPFLSISLYLQDQKHIYLMAFFTRGNITPASSWIWLKNTLGKLKSTAHLLGNVSAQGVLQPDLLLTLQPQNIALEYGLLCFGNT